MGSQSETHCAVQTAQAPADTNVGVHLMWTEKGHFRSQWALSLASNDPEFSFPLPGWRGNMWGQITSDILHLGRVGFFFFKIFLTVYQMSPFLHLWHLGKMNHSVWTGSQPSPKFTHFDGRVTQRVLWNSILVQCDCLVCLTRNLQASLQMGVQPTASRRISTSWCYFKVEERWILLSPLIES